MYKLNKFSITRLLDGANIPFAVGNTDYDAYLLWVASGGVPLPIDPPTPAELNAPILAALLALDAKSNRPMLEGDVARMQAILVEKAALRSQLI